MKLITSLIITASLILSIAGCESEEACLSNQNAVQAGLFSAWWDQDIDTILTEVSMTGLNMQDSIYRNQTVSELFLPLNYYSDTTSFVISTKTLKDTIHFIYEKELDFISGECGYIFSFDLDTVIHSNAFIDSVSVIYPAVQYGETLENIKLYIY
jgi:hypothetical protein